MDNFLLNNNIPDQSEKKVVDNYYKCIVPFSHLLGALTGVITDYITSVFPKDYIKSIWNSKEEPFEQRSKAFRDFMLKPRPMMLIEPSFDPSEESEFRPLSEFDNDVSNDPDMNIKFGIRNSFKVIERDNFQLFMKPRRYKMNFKISFVFDSDVARMEAQMYMRQTIRHRLPIVLRKFIENVLPRDYMRAIAEMNNQKLDTEEFVKWLNLTTSMPISYRFNPGTGNYSYFAILQTPMDVRFTEGPSSNEPIKKGQITVSASFSENIDVEFTAASLYYLRTAKDIGASMNESVFVAGGVNIEDKINVVAVDNMFSQQIPVGDDIVGDFNKVKTIKIQADHTGEDVLLNIKDHIEELEILTMIEYYQKHKLPIDFVMVAAYEGLTIMDPMRLEYNKDTLELLIKDCTIYKTYYLNIYINRLKVNGYRDKLYNKTADPTI